MVPTSCYNVYIPGNSTHFPQLTDHPVSPAVCHAIYFMPGGELGRPDLLSYKKAYIQYNFGLKQTQQTTNQDNIIWMLNNSVSTTERMLYSASVSADPIEREHWYMLSSPLKEVVTGDLGFGGFPLTFLMKFDPLKEDPDTDYPVGNWTTPYTSMIEPVASNSTDGFAFFMYGYDPEGDDQRNLGCDESGYFNNIEFNDLVHLPAIRDGESYGIEKINGILELPFFADSTNLYAHRTQIFDSLSNKSTFYYIWDDESNFNILTGRRESKQRASDNGNYRFAPESFKSGKWVFENPIKHPVTGLNAGDEFLVGNPYMSSIDIVKFFKDNENSIAPLFRVWNGETKVFDDYHVDISSGEITLTNPVDMRYIAPFQGFFLKYAGTGDVQFDVRNISIARPTESSYNLRNARDVGETNIVRIQAENDFTSSYVVIGYKNGASDGYNRGEDVPKLFSPFGSVPELYSLAGETPVSIRFIPNSREVTVPLGIKTDRTGVMRLTFTGMDQYIHASKIELIDAKENKTIDLTGKSTYTYTFNHTEKGIQNGRFALRFGTSATAFPDVNPSDDLKVYGDSKGIYVITPSYDPVQHVMVYDLQGRKLYESTLNAGYYPFPGNWGQPLLIVKVVTTDRTKTVKLVVD